MTSEEFPCTDGEVMVEADQVPRTEQDAELLEKIIEMRELVYAGKLVPSEPTDFPPGSLEKKAVLALRHEYGVPLWNPRDLSNLKGAPIPKETPVGASGCFDEKQFTSSDIEFDD